MLIVSKRVVYPYVTADLYSRGFAADHRRNIDVFALPLRFRVLVAMGGAFALVAFGRPYFARHRSCNSTREVTSAT